MNNVFVFNAATLYSHTGAATVDTLATINTLANGSPAFFQEDGVKVLDTGTFVKAGEIVNLYMGRETGVMPQHCRINLPTLSFNKQAYVAPVASIQHVGNNGATGTLNLNAVSRQGSYYGITFVNLDKEVYDNSRKVSVSLNTLTDNITSATLVAALVAEINKNAKVMESLASVVAISTTGLAFTGKAGINFSVQGIGLIEAATLTNNDAFKPGANTYDWAKELEFNESTVEGRSSAMPPEGEMDPLYTVASRVVSGANYTVYTLTSSWLRSGYPSANANAQESNVTLLVPAANITLIASLDAVLLNLTVKYVAP